MIIDSKKWRKQEFESLIIKSTCLNKGDLVNCEAHSYNSMSNELSGFKVEFKTTLDEVRDTLLLFYDYDETLISNSFGSSFKIIRVKEWGNEIFPNLKAYWPKLYELLIKDTLVTNNDFIINELLSLRP